MVFINNPFHFFHRPFYHPTNHFTTTSSSNTWLINVDILENEKDIILNAEFPGVKNEDIELDVKNGVLLISGEKKEEKKEGVDVVFSDRTFGRFIRRYQLPDGVDDSKIKASFDNGVLQVTIPKPEKKDTNKRISISSKL